MYQCRVPDGEVSIEFTVPDNGTWQINAIMQYGLVGGIYQPSLNGQKIGGPIDFSATGAFDALWTRLDIHELKAGETHRLKFSGVGRSPHVRSRLRDLHGIAMSHLVLLRLEDMPGYEKALEAVKASGN